MCKSSIGELKLSPIKDEGKFVFINNEIRMNGKLNKGDAVKIYVTHYEVKDGVYHLSGNSQPFSKLTVRGNAVSFETQKEYANLGDLYNDITEFYKNRFYFGNK